MNLLKLIRTMEAVALRQPAVKCVVENDVFRLNSLPNAQYGVFAWTQGTHAGDPDSDFRTFAFTIFYVDRLRTDGKNEIEVQSVACDTLANILKTLSERYGVEVGEYTISVFNQRFADQCAGAFANVRLEVPALSNCDEPNNGDFNEDFSDDFWTVIL